jgi:uncharacterized membrane protein
MSEVDVLKEKIAYLKLWLGIMVVADIGLVGWLLGNYIVANWALINAAIAAIFVISFGTFVLHKRIEKEFSGLRTFDHAYCRGTDRYRRGFAVCVRGSRCDKASKVIA